MTKEEYNKYLKDNEELKKKIYLTTTQINFCKSDFSRTLLMEKYNLIKKQYLLNLEKIKNYENKEKEDNNGKYKRK